MSYQVENKDGVKITIRLAVESDAHLLARFRYDFRSSLNPASENEEEFVKRCSIWMRARLRANSCWRCWIAERDQTPVGNLWMQLIEKIPNPTVEPECHAYVTNFYVQQEVRSKGIGTMLLTT